MIAVSPEFSEPLGRLTYRPAQRVDEDLFLATEVVVNDPRGDSGLQGHVPHPNPRRTITHKDTRGGRHEVLASVEFIRRRQILRNRYGGVSQGHTVGGY